MSKQLAPSKCWMRIYPLPRDRSGN